MEEVRAGEEVGLASDAFMVHPEWRRELPWLVQGITTAAPVGRGGDALDLRLFGSTDGSGALERWEELRAGAGMGRMVVGRQVHGARLRVHGDPAPGVLVVDGTDAHASRDAGVLLAVTVADCVPVSVVDPEDRVVALAHAGWRGLGEGVLEEVLATLVDRFACPPGRLRAHLGPAICGDCYEVGPEVHRALGHPEPTEPEPLDLRAEAERHLLAAGLEPARVTVSSLCTLCGDVPFHSHRGGSSGRQAALLGLRWVPAT